MKRKVLFCLFAAVLCWLPAGCNMFGFASGNSDDDYVLKGQEDLRNARFPEAIDHFTKALEKNPRNAEAHWGRAKAYMRSTGYNSIKLLSDVSKFDLSGSSNNAVPLPFMTMQADSADRLLHAVTRARPDLDAIYRGDAQSAELNANTIGLDVASVLTINGLLQIRDTNRDGSINAQDVDGVVLQMVNGNCQVDWQNLTPQQQDATREQVKALVDDGGAALKVVIADVLDLGAVQGDFTQEQRDRIKDSFGFDAANIDDLINQIDQALQ